MQADHTILEAGHANLLSRLMEGLQMGWCDHPTLGGQLPTRTSWRRTKFRRQPSPDGTQHALCASLGAEVLVEESRTADGDERPVKIGPLKMLVGLGHYLRQNWESWKWTLDLLT